MSNRQPDRYAMRAQFVGVLYWTCPRCAKLNRTTMRPTRWQIQCASEHCKRAGTIGLVLYHATRDHYAKGDPPDGLITEPVPEETTEASHGLDLDPMPVVTPKGPRKLFTPVHSVEL